ncbi:hypothetical protein [Methylomonas sp. AM2-LC]|uniref:hypothetical protein n=1 Tax=Methylomonas sp. AM2-LC TaxID=3153301 RepID=UPI003264A5F1
MALLNTNERRSGPFLGNGSTTLVMSFPFLVYTTADVLVSWSDSAGNATYSGVDLVLGTDYTVVINPDQVAAPGCTVTTTAVVPATTSLVITSNLSNTVNVQVAGAAAQAINSGFDRLCILIQQLAEWLSRTPSVPVGGIGNQAPGSLVFGVGLDGNGNPVPVLSKLANIAQSAVSAFMANVIAAANLPGLLAAMGLSSVIKNFLQTTTATSALAVLSPGVLCQAFVRFNGVTTTTILASFNVSSVTRNAAGDYTINFTTPFADANYAACITAKQNNDNNGNISVANQYYGGSSASACEIIVCNNIQTKVDANTISATFYR